MNRCEMTMLLEQLEADVRYQAETVKRHHFWLTMARDWRARGNRRQSALCLLHAASRRNGHIEVCSRIKRCKAELLEACHD